MNTIGINIPHPMRRFRAIVIVVALALSFAAIATLRAETNATNGGIFAWVTGYLTEVGEALGSE